MVHVADLKRAPKAITAASLKGLKPPSLKTQNLFCVGSAGFLKVVEQEIKLCFSLAFVRVLFKKALLLNQKKPTFSIGIVVNCEKNVQRHPVPIGFQMFPCYLKKRILVS